LNRANERLDRPSPVAGSLFYLVKDSGLAGLPGPDRSAAQGRTIDFCLLVDKAILFVHSYK